MKKNSLKKEVYDQIFRKIFNNEFELDEILKEKDLSIEFNVSRAPVREALIELCNENVLKNIPRAGYQIVKLNYNDVYNATEVRLLLEMNAAEIGFDRITPENVRILEDKFLNKQDEVLNYDWNEYRGNVDFHLYLCSFSQNELLCSMVEKALIILWRAFAQNFRMGYPFLDRQKGAHSNLVEFIKSNNKEKYLEALKLDINSMLESINRNVR